MALEYNYIKENFRAFSEMLNETVDAYPVGSWENKDERDGFKIYLLSDYIMFLYNMNYLPIQANNPLYKQKEFCKKLFIMCDRYKSGGLYNAIPKDKISQFIDMLGEHIKEYVNNELDLELKKQEKQFYSKMAFAYKDEPNPVQQYNGRLAQLKEEAFKNNLG